MIRTQTWLLSGIAALSGAAIYGLSTSAEAADFSPPCVPPPVCEAQEPANMASPFPHCAKPFGPLCAVPVVPVEKGFGGWYLRGDIGFSSQRVGRLDNVLYNNPGQTIVPKGMGFDSAGIFGLGVGYQVNNWLRFDVTGEYRAAANFKGSDAVTFNGGFLSDNYTGTKSEWVAMINGYVDLGTWHGITPFVGAGIGAANVTISGFRDDGLGFSGNGPIVSTAYAATRSKWNFAWALHAGLAYQVTDCLTLELAYRYINLGDGVTGDIVAGDGTNNVNNPMHFKNITSNDVKIGLRWYLDGAPSAAKFAGPSKSFVVPAAPPPPVIYDEPVRGPLMRRG